MTNIFKWQCIVFSEGDSTSAISETEKMNTDAILKGTTLCMVVKDQRKNNAGGIVRQLVTQAQQYEEVVVLDLFSRDGTYEVLRELRKEPGLNHIRIFQKKINGAKARNFALGKVRTKQVMFLEPNEVMKSDDCLKLADFVEKTKRWGYCFNVDYVFANNSIERQMVGVQNPRLFRMSYFVKYEDVPGTVELTRKLRRERIIPRYSDVATLSAPVIIHRFAPSMESVRENGNKGREWKQINANRSRYD